MNGDAITKVLESAARPVEYLAPASSSSSRIVAPDNWREIILSAPSVASFVATATLAGFVDFITANRDALPLADCIVGVGPRQVELLQPLDGFGRRPVRCMSRCRYEPPTVGVWTAQDKFLLQLRTQFMPGPDRDAMLTMLATLTTEGQRISDDNGLSQVVVVRTGITTVKRDNVPAVLSMQPRFTFAEVEQPSVNYVIRLREERHDGGVECALFEADHGQRDMAACEAIYGWLRSRLPDELAIVR